MTTKSTRVSLYCCIVIIGFLSAPVAYSAEKPTKPVETFRKAKELARDQVYFDRRITFYCRCFFDPTGKSGGSIDPSDCGFESSGQRAKRLEWEHVVPASRLASNRACWKTGHDLCVKARTGKKFKGRKCCEKNGVDDDARHMINDLHNLVPSIGKVNADRSNHPYGVVPDEPRQYGACDFEVADRPHGSKP